MCAVVMNLCTTGCKGRGDKYTQVIARQRLTYCIVYLCSSDRAALWFSPRLSFSLPKDVAGSISSDGTDMALCVAGPPKSESCTDFPPCSGLRGLQPDRGDLGGLEPMSLRLQHTLCHISTPLTNVQYLCCLPLIHLQYLHCLPLPNFIARAF